MHALCEAPAPTPARRVNGPLKAASHENSSASEGSSADNVRIEGRLEAVLIVPLDGSCTWRRDGWGGEPFDHSSGGGQLNRQREAVGCSTQGGNQRLRSLASTRSSGTEAVDTRHEQLNGFHAADLSGRRRAPSCGTVSGRISSVLSPLAQVVLATSSRSRVPAQRRKIASTSQPHTFQHLFAVVEHHEHAARTDRSNDGVDRTLAAHRLCARNAATSVSGTAAGSASGCEIDETHSFAESGLRRRWPTRTASRVLPTPPGPHNVTRR